MGSSATASPAATPVTVAGRVDEDALPPLHPAEDDRGRQVLDRVDRLAALADHEPEVGAGQRGGELLLVLMDLDAHRSAERHAHAIEELP
jgi:hypothetical protein